MAYRFGRFAKPALGAAGSWATPWSKSPLFFVPACSSALEDFPGFERVTPMSAAAQEKTLAEVVAKELSKDFAAVFENFCHVKGLPVGEVQALELREFRTLALAELQRYFPSQS